MKEGAHSTRGSMSALPTTTEEQVVLSGTQQQDPPHRCLKVNHTWSHKRNHGSNGKHTQHVAGLHNQMRHGHCANAPCACGKCARVCGNRSCGNLMCGAHTCAPTCCSSCSTNARAPRLAAAAGGAQSVIHHCEQVQVQLEAAALVEGKMEAAAAAKGWGFRPASWVQRASSAWGVTRGVADANRPTRFVAVTTEQESGAVAGAGAGAGAGGGAAGGAGRREERWRQSSGCRRRWRTSAWRPSRASRR